MPPGRLRWLPRQNIAPAAQFPVTTADRPVESPWPIIHHFAVDVYTLDHGPLESAHWSPAWVFADRQSVQSDFLKFAFAVNYTCSSESCGFQAMEWETCRCKRSSIFIFASSYFSAPKVPRYVPASFKASCIFSIDIRSGS